jgi:hypothetical protein
MESKKVVGRVFEGLGSDRFHHVSPEAGHFMTGLFSFVNVLAFNLFLSEAKKIEILVPIHPWVPDFKTGLKKENKL